MAIQDLLSDIGRALRKDRPLIPQECGYRIIVADPDRRFAQIWLRTRGCKHDVLKGGCTICNYWVSSPPTVDDFITSFISALDHLIFSPSLLVLSASGSFLDPWEIAPEARNEILTLLKHRCPDVHVILETHPDTVSEETLEECYQLLGSPFTIEMGLESADNTLLKCCLNKPTTTETFARAVSCIQQKPYVSCIANVMIGIPFLTKIETVDQAVDTVQWAFEQGVDECVLFPLNLKLFTFAYWLSEHALFPQPSLWALVDVLTRIEEEKLPKVNFAWHRIDRGQATFWDKGIIPPCTCEKCCAEILTLLDKYLSSGNRKEVVHSLTSTGCSCYKEWVHNLESNIKPLAERLVEGYRTASVTILGEDYWKTNCEAIVNELEQLFHNNA